MDGPTKGLQTISLLSQEARLKGWPKLCSDCGFCDTSHRPAMARSCVFVENRAEELELRFHGRSRATPDELLFGVYRRMVGARLRQANPQAQWSGIVTRLGALLLDQGIVEAVVTTRRRTGHTLRAAAVPGAYGGGGDRQRRQQAVSVSRPEPARRDPCQWCQARGGDWCWLPGARAPGDPAGAGAGAAVRDWHPV